ncbi:hypothetical protein ILYODFUR_027912 [Ilyodon furcidens]|uniref:Uncharacterized protein n=1 Tax=Ilyodon furcidens TaxID=33524 RepID=A0ABV0VKA1_9TELE
MGCFITQHNATDVASFEGANNWHADCRDVDQRCYLSTECSSLFQKPSPKGFQRIWQYIGLSSTLEWPSGRGGRLGWVCFRVEKRVASLRLQVGEMSLTVVSAYETSSGEEYLVFLASQRWDAGRCPSRGLGHSARELQCPRGKR